MQKLSRFVYFVLIIGSLFGSWGCSLKFNEDPPPKAVFDFNNVDFNCFDKTTERVENFLSGEGTPGEMEQFWDCSSSALITFMKRVKGSQDENHYTPKELANFLETYFFDDKKIPESLIVEIMNIKMALLGGSPTAITRNEILRAIELMSEFRQMTTDIYPHMKIIAHKWTVGEDHNSAVTRFEEVNTALQKTALKLGSFLEKSDKSYSFSSFENLFNELFKVFGKGREEWVFNQQLHKYLPIVVTFKGVLVGEPRDQIKPEQWTHVLSVVARAGSQYLRYQYFLKGKSLTSGEGWTDFYRAINDAFGLFYETVAKKPGQKISLHELKELTNILTTLWPEVNISEGFLKEILRIKRLFLGGSEDSLSLEDLQRAPALIADFKDLSNRLEPYADIYTLKWRNRDYGLMDLERFNLASDTLQSLSAKVGERIESAGQQFNLTSILSLLEEVDRFSGNNSESTLTAFVRSYLPHILQIKRILIGEPAETVSPSQWRHFLLFGTRLYIQYLRYEYFVKGSSVFATHKWDHFFKVVDDSSDLLYYLVEHRPQKKIDLSELVELSGILKAIMKDGDITPQLVAEILKLKQVLIGGSDQNISLGDIKALPGLVLKFKRFYDGLNPYFDIYLDRWNPADRDERALVESVIQLEKVVTEIAQLATSSQTSYELDRLPILINEVEKIKIKNLDLSQIKKILNEQIVEIKEIKGLLVGEPRETIAVSEWKRVLVSLAQGFGEYLRYKYFIKGYDISKDPTLSSFEELSLGLTDVLRGLISYLPQQQLNKTDIVRLAQVVSRFLNKGPFSERLAEEILKLKQILFSGSDSALAAKDLEQVIDIIPQMVGIWRESEPYLDVYLTKWQERNEVFFEKSLGQLLKAASDFSGILLSQNQNYELVRLSNLLGEWDRFNQYTEQSSWTRWYNLHYKDILKLKNLAVGGPEHLMQGTQWQKFFVTAARGYRAFLRFHYFGENRKWENDKDWSFVSLIFQEGVTAVVSALENRKVDKLTKQELLILSQSVQNFSDEKKISNEVIEELLNIRSYLQGGSPEFVSLKQLKSTPQLLTKVRELYARARPYWDYYSQKEKFIETVSADYVRSAEQNLLKIADEVSAMAEKSGREIGVYGLSMLFPNVEDWILKTGKTPVSTFLRDYFALVAEIKKNLVSGSQYTIAPDEWTKSLRIAAIAYVEYVRVRYLLLGHEVSRGEGLKHLDRFAHVVISVMQESVKIRPQKAFTIEDINEVIEVVYQLKIPLGGLKKEIVLATYPPIVKKMLRTLTNDYYSIGIESSTLQVATEEFDQWLGAQYFIDFIFNNYTYDGAIRHSFLKTEFDKMVEQWQRRNGPAFNSVAEMRKLLVERQPLALTNNGNMFFDYDESKYLHNFKSVSGLNWQRAMLRLVNRGYSKDLVRARLMSGLLSDETKELFDDIRAFGVDAKILDPRTPNIWKTIFTQADLFTYFADGNNILDPYEGTQTIAMILAGATKNNEMYEKFLSSCPQQGSDIFGVPLIPYSCFLDNFFGHFAYYFASMPRLVTYLKTLSAEEIEILKISMYKAAKYADTPENMFEKGSANVVVQIFQFIETFYIRFDQNQDGVLHYDEAMQAFPIFRETLKAISGKQDEKVLQTIYTFLLKNGRAPTTSEFIYWYTHRGQWQSIATTRVDVVKMFASILETMNAPSSVPNEYQ